MDEKVSEYMLTALETLKSVCEDREAKHSEKIKAAEDLAAIVVNILQVRKMFDGEEEG